MIVYKTSQNDETVTTPGENNPSSSSELTAVCSKYLDHKGAQELVTQFKAYVDNLAGGSS